MDVEEIKEVPKLFKHIVKKKDNFMIDLLEFKELSV
jgi:hypothetical protein